MKKNLMSNQGLTLQEMFRKRDYIKGLIDLGYDLKPELCKLEIAIQIQTSKENQ